MIFSNILYNQIPSPLSGKIEEGSLSNMVSPGVLCVASVRSIFIRSRFPLQTRPDTQACGHASTTQILFKYYTNTIQIPYKYIQYRYLDIYNSIPQIQISIFSQILYKYYTNTIQIPYKYYTDIYIDTIQIPQIQISIFFYCTKDNTDIEIQ